MEEKDYIDFVYEIESDCNQLSQDIISRLCKRAIKEMSKQLPPHIVPIVDGYPAGFSFFDVLSIELQSKFYDEINPFLQDYIETVLDNEYKKLPALERFVLDHSECAEHLRCDDQAIENKIYDTFREMLNEHYGVKKIQDYVCRL